MVPGQRPDVGQVLDASKKSAGFFHKGLIHRTSGRAPEVEVVENGHFHITENYKCGVSVFFGGGGCDISEYGETIRTYKRTENNLNEVIDDIVLVGRGPPPPFEGVI